MSDEKGGSSEKRKEQWRLLLKIFNQALERTSSFRLSKSYKLIKLFLLVLLQAGGLNSPPDYIVHTLNVTNIYYYECLQAPSPSVRVALQGVF